MLIAKNTNCRSRIRAVGRQQGTRNFLGNSTYLFSLAPVHVMPDVPGHASDRLPQCKRTRKVDLDRIDAGNEMHNFNNISAGLRQAHLPFGFGKCCRKRSQLSRADFKTGSECFTSIVRCGFILRVVFKRALSRARKSQE